MRVKQFSPELLFVIHKGGVLTLKSVDEMLECNRKLLDTIFLCT